MKSLIKLAMGAAIAGAVIALLVKERSRMRSEAEDAALAASAEKAGQGAQGFTIGELLSADANAGPATRPH